MAPGIIAWAFGCCKSNVLSVHRCEVDCGLYRQAPKRGHGAYSSGTRRGEACLSGMNLPVHHTQLSFKGLSSHTCPAEKSKQHLLKLIIITCSLGLTAPARQSQSYHGLPSGQGPMLWHNPK